MADNVDFTPGTGATGAADDIGGVFYPRVKISLGADGAAVDAVAGAGTVGTGVQRVTLASDDPGVAHLSRLTSSATNVAAGSALATTSFIIGSRYNSSLPTFTNGQEGAFQIDANGRMLTAASLAAGENFIGIAGGVIARPSANFTRPADTTAYASGDLVANSTTAGSVTAMSFTVARVAAGNGMIRRARIRKSGTSTSGATFRLHLYNAAPSTITNGDNGAFSTSGVADYLGAIDVNVDRAFTDGAAGNGLPITGAEINFKLASGTTIVGLLEARGAYTPGNAEVFTVDLEVIQN